ncbi:MAG: sulfatase-like hydrolase/transferase [Candidatus Micrarchaeia archaeon]
MQERPNIVFILTDTLRADFLDVYNGRVKTKVIREIAKKSTIYKNAIAPGTYTVPSHVSLFLNKRVRSIKSLTKDPMKYSDKNTDPFLKKSVYINKNELTLARHLGMLGYDTALFSNNPFLSQSTGLGEGFSHIENLWFKDKIDKNRRSVKLVLELIENEKIKRSLVQLTYLISRVLPQRRLDKLYLDMRIRLNKHFSEEYGFYDLDKGISKTTESIKKYVRGDDSKRPKFIFVNYMEPHEGYPTNLVKEGYVEQDKWLYLSGLAGSNAREGLDAIKGAYSKRIEYMDKKLGSFIDMLKREGVLDNAIIIIASDHGQAFMEHGVMYHNMFPYNEIANVPLITSRFVSGKQIDISEIVENPVSTRALHESILNVAYGKNDVIDGTLRRDNFIFSDHIGITEVWDKCLLEKLKYRSESVKKIYNVKKYHNTQATAVYYKDYKLIHYFGRGIKDQLFDLSESGEEEDVTDSNRSIAYEMLNASKRYS